MENFVSSEVAPPRLVLPRLYAIANASPFSSTADLIRFAEELVAGGITLLQYRNKSGNSREIVDHAVALKQRLASSVKLVMNDRADLCVAADFDGVHVGQDDLSPKGARTVVGAQRWLGVSTHNPDQLRAAAMTSADYLAIGPVFATSSKQNPDPVVGLAGIRAARALTRRPLVAIGGITRDNCESVIEAGADSVAVISDLIDEPRKSVQDFLRRLG
jgi:thiamine-phosphate pyrophosphorylase